MARALRLFTLLAAVAAVTACSVKDTKTPPLSGPSELGLSLTLQATPDVLTQDGAAQSQIIVLARDPNGQPVRSVTCRVEITVDGNTADFGTLSTRQITTGSDGRASLVYTAPPTSAATVTGTTVVITVVPVGTDYATAWPRSVSIRLLPLTIVEPPQKGAWFVVSPAQPTVNQHVVLDGSGSTSLSGRPIVTYDWSFGDGEKKQTTVPYTSHDWVQAGNYAVSLTITDDVGGTSTKMMVITVVAAPK